MKKTVRILSLLLIAVMLFSMAACDKPVEEKELAEIKVGVLKGPTGVGAVRLMDKVENGYTKGKYDIKLHETTEATALVAKVMNGEIDIAAVPINTASAIYNKSIGAIQVIAANALGVLSIVGYNDMESIQELKGAVIHTINKGATPEYILRYILTKNGIDPDKDVTIKFYDSAESAVGATAVFDGEVKSVAMIPEPAVTAMTIKYSGLKTVFNMTEEWDKVSDTRLVQGVLIARKDFIEKNAETVRVFIEEYSESVGYINGYPSKAAPLLVKYGIVGNEKIAEYAIPGCNVVCITDSEMKEDVSGMLGVLYESNPSSIGGKLPKADFYYDVPAMSETEAAK